MANLDNIINLVRDMNTPYMKLFDGRDNLLYTIDSGDSGVEESISKLQKLQPFLQPYGRIKITAATPAAKKQSWANSFKWELDFFANNNNANLPQQNLPINPSSGMISLREAELLAQVQRLETEKKYDAQFAEINKRLEQNNASDPIEKYLPLAGLFMNIDDSKMANMMKLASLQGAMNGKNIGMAGTEKNITTVEGTAEEKVKQVELLMVELSSKVNIDTIIALLKGLNKNPEMATKALAFL